MSNILLYPVGAFVSFTSISSFWFISVISTIPKSTNPFDPVVFVSAPFPGNVISNSAPSSFTLGLSLSTFSSCNL